MTLFNLMQGLPSHTLDSCRALGQVLIIHRESYSDLGAFEQKHEKRNNPVISLHTVLCQQFFQEIQSSAHHSLETLQLY